MLKAEPSESAAISEFDDDKPSLAQPGEDVKPWFVYPLLAGAVGSTNYLFSRSS